MQNLIIESYAEASLIKAQDLEQDILDYLYARADFYLMRQNLHKAISIAMEMVVRHPAQQIGRDILNLIENSPGADSD